MVRGYVSSGWLRRETGYIHFFIYALTLHVKWSRNACLNLINNFFLFISTILFVWPFVTCALISLNYLFNVACIYSYNAWYSSIFTSLCGISSIQTNYFIVDILARTTAFVLIKKLDGRCGWDIILSLTV